MEKSNPIVIEVSEGGLLPLKDARGARLTCVEGTLWLTLERSSRDIVLQAGESLEIDRDGTTLVQGMADSRVAIKPAAGGYRGLFVRYSPATTSAVPA